MNRFKIAGSERAAWRAEGDWLNVPFNLSFEPFIDDEVQISGRQSEWFEILRIDGRGRN